MPCDVQELRKQLGALIRTHRTGLGISQARLARQVGLEKQRVSKVELAEIETSDDVLIKLSLGLKIEVPDLLRGLADRLDVQPDRVAS